MSIVTEGLVLRQVKVGEADRILTILTPDLGIVTASAKGSLRLKNKLFSACGLFCYSEFGLAAKRNTYVVEDGTVRQVFHGISRTVEGMSLAAYLTEIAIQLSPAPPEAEEQLRLLLNSLYMISCQKHPVKQLKIIYELRSLSMAGYLPQLLACRQCGKYDGGEFYFDVNEGYLLCAECAAKANHIPNLDMGALYAMRHVCLCEDKKLFSFTLSENSTKDLLRVSEQYTLNHLEQPPKSLSFLKSVLN